jgi:hypothetical protein
VNRELGIDVFENSGKETTHPRRRSRLNRPKSRGRCKEYQQHTKRSSIRRTSVDENYIHLKGLACGSAAKTGCKLGRSVKLTRRAAIPAPFDRSASSNPEILFSYLGTVAGRQGAHLRETKNTLDRLWQQPISHPAAVDLRERKGREKTYIEPSPPLLLIFPNKLPQTLNTFVKPLEDLPIGTLIVFLPPGPRGRLGRQLFGVGGGGGVKVGEGPAKCWVQDDMWGLGKDERGKGVELIWKRKHWGKERKRKRTSTKTVRLDMR